MAEVRAAALARAVDAGLSGLLLAGVDLADWQAQGEVQRAAPPALMIGTAFGIHPQIVEELNDAELDDQLAQLARVLAGHEPGLPPPQAIGELGLDALTPTRRQALPRQERVFRAQLSLARQVERPLVLHILRTHGEALRILRRDGVPRCGGVVHSYSGSAELVPDYLALGLHLSFSGAVTWPGARRLQAAARVVPSERLLIETDAPDQTPEGHRPGPNEPATLPAICASLAALRGQDAATLSRITAENAYRLFRLPVPRPDARR